MIDWTQRNRLDLFDGRKPLDVRYERYGVVEVYADTWQDGRNEVIVSWPKFINRNIKDWFRRRH